MGKNYCDEKLNLIGVIHQNGLKQDVDWMIKQDLALSYPEQIFMKFLCKKTKQLKYKQQNFSTYCSCFA